MLEIDEIIRSKRKTIALVVQPDGRLVVRAPKRATLKQIHAMVEQYTDWIQDKKFKALERSTRFAPWSFVDGSTFPYLGESIPLGIVPGTSASLRFNGSSFILTDGATAQAASLFEKWYRKQARRVFTERIREYVTRYGFQYQKIRISSARTRWGSCSSRGTLSFTWRLVMAPLEIIDYVVVHELIHLQHPNHSKDFWRNVETILPDFKKRRKWLKENGPSLHWP